MLGTKLPIFIPILVSMFLRNIYFSYRATYPDELVLREAEDLDGLYIFVHFITLFRQVMIAFPGLMIESGLIRFGYQPPAFVILIPELGTTPVFCLLGFMECVRSSVRIVQRHSDSPAEGGDSRFRHLGSHHMGRLLGHGRVGCDSHGYTRHITVRV